MTMRSISIRNRSGISQSFAVIQPPPPAGDDTQNDTCITVLQASPLITGDGNSCAQFHLTSEYYAFCGTGRKDDDGRLCIAVSNALPAKLESNASKGSKFELSKPDGSAAGVLSLIDESITAAGAFGILTDASLATQDPRYSLYMGVGVKGPGHGRIVPIFATEARPNIQTMFYPEPRYYIVLGKFQPGTVISPQESSNALAVDFAGSLGNNVEFVFDGKFKYELADGVSTA
ncbi:hypothetical protein LX32DRAFT_701076 [Colletotrichum zoysiae]|uniref:Uncharacterized protein n=1 Tax=Colletotrichum zoysiae TaxID=1216348 RepID=A0AAD9LZE7_9PEZI|nr:hypothetical protein LX32DRAFT_701076 [Colletotrichum zoysiae]